MAFSYKNTGAWGAGNGAGAGGLLTSLQADGNTHEIEKLRDEFDALIAAGFTLADPPMTVGSGSVTFHFTDGGSDTTDVIVPLPVLALNSRGEWQNDTAYAYGDIVQVRTVGVFLALQSHTSAASPATFDPDEEDSDGAFWQQIGFLRDVDYDIAFSVIGDIPGDGSLLAKISFARACTIAAASANAQAHLDVAIADPGVSEIAFQLYKNATAIGFVTFTFGAGSDGAGGQTGTVSIPDAVSFAAGDRLRLLAPELGSELPSDGMTSAADLSVSIPATRDDI